MGKKNKKLEEELLGLKVDEAGEENLHSDLMDLTFDVDPLEEVKSKHDTNASAEQVLPEYTVRLVTPPKKKDAQEEKVGYGLPAKQQVPRSAYDSNVDGLKQSEHLRIAQKKINDLEEEIAKLLRENEDLATAGETFKKLNDDYFATIDSLKSQLTDQKKTYGQEIELLKRITESKEKTIIELKQQIEDLSARLDNNFLKVRKREKDLEHRLEIAKMEEAALVKSKDQLILDLKRQNDQVVHESENFRKKSQENYNELRKKDQVARGAVRALRIALAKLEGEDESDYGINRLGDDDGDIS